MREVKTDWETLYCDFCEKDSVASFFPAQTFQWKGSESVGWWAACTDCQILIEANEWAELHKRCLDLYEMNHPEHQAHLIAISQNMRNLHENFRVHQTGEAVPVDEAIEIIRGHESCD